MSRQPQDEEHESNEEHEEELLVEPGSLRERAAIGWSRATYAGRRYILVGCLAVVIGGLPWVGGLLDSTDNGSFEVQGSLSHEAMAKLGSAFPASAHTESLVFLSEARDGTLSELNPRFCEWQLALSRAITAKYPCAEGEVCFLRQVLSYCDLAERNATYIAATLVNNGDISKATAAVLEVSYALSATAKRDELIDWSREKAKSLLADARLEDELRVGMTGFDVFAGAGQDSTTADLETLDTVSLPLALLVMAVTLGSLPLLLVPLCNMACTTVLEFLIMGRVAASGALTVATFVPSVMMTITLALSFDYSLFVCSRYLEARRDGLPPYDRVAVVLAGAGHTILVSGSTLVACFLGLLAFPSDLLRGMGCALSVGLCCAMLFNLMLSPALLHCIGEPLCVAQDRVFRVIGRFLKAAAGPLEEPLLLETKRRSYWYAGARLLWDDRRVALAVVVGVLAAFSPVCLQARHLVVTADPSAIAPAPSGPWSTERRVSASFGGGAIAPLTVLFEAKEDLFTPEAFGEMSRVLFEVLGEHDLATVSSVTRLNGADLLPSDYAGCLLSKTEWCTSLLALAMSSTTSKRTSIAARLTLKDSPFSRKGFDWIESAQRKLQKVESEAFTGVYLAGTPCVLRDFINSLYGSFPIVIACTLALVFLLLGCSFQSLLVPLRSVVALCLTLSFSFGSCVCVYQRAHQPSDPSKVPPFKLPFTTRGSDGGIAWLAPLVCFSVVVGLALDYDVFLLARVYEYRVTARLSDRKALLNAVEKTGVIITSAGMIMAISFGGLFLSSTTILNQTAWLLCSAVLFDTFIIRTLLMPSLCSLSRSFMFWPAKLPEPLAGKLLDDESDESDDEVADDSREQLII